MFVSTDFVVAVQAGELSVNRRAEFLQVKKPGGLAEAETGQSSPGRSHGERHKGRLPEGSFPKGPSPDPAQDLLPLEDRANRAVNFFFARNELGLELA